MKITNELSYKQGFLRALEWRAVAVLVDAVIVYLITHQFLLSLGITGASNITKTIVHALWIKKRGHD
jgi:hypothetical protein